MPIPHLERDWRELTSEEFEEMRHAYEVNHCLREGYDFTTAHVQGVREKRGIHAAARIWRDVKANWQAEKDAAQQKLAAVV